jgi:hypothetical protein
VEQAFLTAAAVVAESIQVTPAGLESAALAAAEMAHSAQMLHLTATVMEVMV